MTKLEWKRPYVGPFDRELADKIAAEFRAKAKPEENMIHNARVRKRRGQRHKYDVQILIEKT